MPPAVDPRRWFPRPSDFPSLPHVYGALRAALDDPRASATRIAEIVSQDAALTARLLRLVNSALYGFNQPVETVSHAVLMVGTAQIHDLALATLVMRRFDGIPADLLDLADFWRHGLATGVAARVLAGARREANVERFFVAGLLHDVGRLVLCRREPEASREALLRCRRDGTHLAAVERELIGTDHAAVGEVLLAAWNLPASLRQAVAHHHAPGAAPDHHVEAAVVHLADVLVHALELGGSGDPRVPPVDAGAWDCVGLAPRALAGVLGDIDRQLNATAPLLDPEHEAGRARAALR